MALAVVLLLVGSLLVYAGFTNRNPGELLRGTLGPPGPRLGGAA